jgi:hypothetical protein
MARILNIKFGNSTVYSAARMQYEQALFSWGALTVSAALLLTFSSTTAGAQGAGPTA